VLEFVRQCYELQLPNELQTLIPYIAKYLDSLKIKQVSEALDIETFANVLKQTSRSAVDKVKIIEEFLGDYTANEQEQRILAGLFVRENVTDLVTANGKECKWLPPEFLRRRR
jgi:hypothetical protein